VDAPSDRGTASVLVAPDKFKGTYTAPAVASALADGVLAAGASPTSLPIADGGDGTAEVLRLALGGERVEADATDALGRETKASFALLDDGRAVIDVAEASGLAAFAADERDALRASSRGTGELIVAAVACGASEVILGAGGSASTDGGDGVIAVLREAGVAPRITVVCDVQVTFERAAEVFAPQKGASAADVESLTRRLAELAARAPRDPRGAPMSGAAGGLAGGLWAHLDASLVRGAAFVLDLIDFDDHLAGSTLAITGEGQLDDQTADGKAVSEVARRAARLGIPCVAVVGRNLLARDRALALGLADVLEAGDPLAISAAARCLVTALSR
jgi:glycerate kinase